MDASIQHTLLIAVAVLVLLAFSVVRCVRRPNASASTQMLGALAALVVVLAHVAERFALWPSMGWGQPHSLGHYMDLASAVLGVGLLAAAAVLAFASRRGAKSR